MQQEEDAMTMTWGPALDAEVAYRHERVVELLRGASAPRTTGPVNPERHARRASAGRPVREVGARRAALRGWLLRGSEAWHVAR